MRSFSLLALSILILNFRNPDSDKFLMPVEDFFSIAGRGTVVTGVVERGKIKVGDSIDFVGYSASSLKGRVTGIESSGVMMKEAVKGQNVGLIISGVDKSKIKRGMVVSQPGSIKSYTDFTCLLYLMTKDEGGRSTAISDNYKPLFQIRNASISGQVIFLTGPGKLEPGDSAYVLVKLLQPAALENKQAFEIKEGSRIVGRGKVVKVVK